MYSSSHTMLDDPTSEDISELQLTLNLKTLSDLAQLFRAQYRRITAETLNAKKNEHAIQEATA